MITRKLSIGLLTFALSSSLGVVAHAQQGYPYGDEHRQDDRRPDDRRGYDQGNPGLQAGFRAGFDNGSRDGQSRHRFNPERAFRRNGRPQYAQQFGGRDDLYRSFHDGFIRGYDRGYHGGDPNDFGDRHDDHHDDHHDDR